MRRVVNTGRTGKQSVPELGDREGRDGGRIGILVSNGLVLMLALSQGWWLLGLLIPYLIENLVIGWFTIRRLLHGARERLPYRTKDGHIGQSAFDRWFMATFFLGHYGLFHVGYFALLGGLATITRMFQNGDPMAGYTGSVPMLVVVGFGLMILIMFWHHHLTYRRLVTVDRVRPVELGKVMLLPYLRILPLHLSILLFGMLVVGGVAWHAQGTDLDPGLLDKAMIAIFVLLKTLIDLRFEAVSRATLAQAPADAG